MSGVETGLAISRVATQEGVWYSLNIEGQKMPVPRYEQGASLVGSYLYVLGGNYAGGRYLNDVWVFDLSQLRWIQTTLKTDDNGTDEVDDTAPLLASTTPALPPSAGHSVTLWKDKLFVIGGHVKKGGLPGKAVKQDILMRVLDTNPLAWSFAVPEGALPSSRGGHTATLVGSKVYMFGGEDTARRVLGELWVLDLESYTWSQAEVTGTPPAARSAHAATAYGDRYVVIFAGGSIATCFNDVHVLDTHTLEWRQPVVASARPTPRAGHSGALLEDTWYIVGGGNNSTGCTEMLALDLSQLPEAHTVSWSIICTIPLRSSLSSEGVSLVPVPSERALVSFGGYNGKYHNSIGLYRVPPPADPSAGASDSLPNGNSAPDYPATPAPTINGGLKDHGHPASQDQGRYPPAVGNGGSRGFEDMQSHLEAARTQAEAASQEAAVAKETAAHELALMRRQLTTAQTSLADTQKSLEEARGQVGAEQARCLQLEAQVAELQERLGAMEEQERELLKLRQLARDTEAKKGTGLWGYIAG